MIMQELAIMSDQSRQSTVVTQDYTELLSIDTKVSSRLLQFQWW